MTIQKQRLLALIEYVQQSARMRTRTVSNVTDHGRFLLLEQQLAGMEGIRANDAGVDGNDELWLSVPRPPGPELPPRPESPWLLPWLVVSGPLLQSPQLATSIEGWALIAAGTHRDIALAPTSVAEAAEPEVQADRRIALTDYDFKAEVERQFAHYLEAAWNPWAEAEQRRRRLARLYVQLFTLQQELSGDMIEGQLELVWGVGVGEWTEPLGATAVAYPLITRLVDLTFNNDTGAAEIRPRDVDPKIELDSYAALDNQGVADAERQAKEFFARATTTLSPFEPETYAALLQKIKACLERESDGMLAGDLSLTEAAERLKITDTWILFARPRSTNLLVQDLEKFARAVDRLGDDDRLPPAVDALVREPMTQSTHVELPAFRGVSQALYETPASTQGKARDLHFPKPFNDEQLRIVQMLEVFDGVVVQGPPGTGKTHTIANIICHWLANGRRVLVTSMKDPALAVLRDKLPAEIQPLAVSLLASEQEGLAQFENSILSIASQVQSVDTAAVAREVVQLEETIDVLHTRLARIDTDAARWARLNLARIELEGESIEPLDAAREVVEHTGRFEWLPDPLGVGPQYAPRFDEADIARLRSARRQLGADIDYADRTLPTLADLPDPLRLLQLHRDRARFARICAETQSAGMPQLVDASEDNLVALQQLKAEIDRIKSLRSEIAQAGYAWIPALRRQFERSVITEPMRLIETLGRDLDQAAAARKAFLSRPVSVPPQAEDNPDFLRAIGNLADGRRPFGLAGVFGKSHARTNISEVQVSGQTPLEPGDWEHVQEYLALLQIWKELVARWNVLAAELGLNAVAPEQLRQGLVPGAPTGGMAAAAQLSIYRKLRSLVTAEERVIEQAARLFPDWTLAPPAGDDGFALDPLERIIAHHITTYSLGAVWSVRDQLNQLLETRSGKVVDDIRRFLADKLGNPSVEEPALLDAWSLLTAELSRIHGLAAPLAAIAEITQRIADSGAPRYAELLRQPLTAAEDKLLPENWREVWRLRRLATHVDSIDSQEELKKLGRMRGEMEHDLRSAYHDLVVARTWLQLARNATPSVRSALQAYLNAIQRIGKGTGKRAVRYRQDARVAAAEAIPAIPCWIMSHYRISESLPAELGCFDLVVIDEASQSDLSALPALLRARKLLIVGDDKQVSPEGIGMEEQKIKSLMQRFLSDQVAVFRAQMSPERSIYDLAKVVFARGGVMLKEHFRCVAPIIEFSKREFYNDELRPLRVPRASERLDPPLLDVLLEGAHRDGDVNLAEVDYIVGEVRRLFAEPRMKHRTIGVVSLLGDDQALRIWDRLNEEFGPELLQRHQLACGDARAFQGRERDIMFLSLVSAPNNVGAPLSRDIFAQRFNVAASRARDRMYLVRSVNLSHLAEGDRLRRGLIAHFAKPSPAEDARPKDLRDLCDSPFERALYDWLTHEGYAVTPQVRVGSYRIDLVVEGSNDTRLAVECDGDRSHGPDKWADDVQRQRVLERAGWVFWRCFAAAFVRRREAVLRDLAATLAAQGIEPRAPPVKLLAVHGVPSARDTSRPVAASAAAH